MTGCDAGDGAGSHCGEVSAVHCGDDFAGLVVLDEDGADGCGKIEFGGVVLIDGDRLHTESAAGFEVCGHVCDPSADCGVDHDGARGHLSGVVGEFAERGFHDVDGLGHG